MRATIGPADAALEDMRDLELVGDLAEGALGSFVVHRRCSRTALSPGTDPRRAMISSVSPSVKYSLSSSALN
jgi:hypothetical protein